MGAGKIIGFGLLGVLALGALSVGGTLFNVFVTQPARMVNKTFDADNVINNYEWYRDAHGNFKAKISQVNQYKKIYEYETDRGEKSRVRIDLAAIQQSCRDLAGRYNANSSKINRSIFRGTNVPETLNMGDCE